MQKEKATEEEFEQAYNLRSLFCEFVLLKIACKFMKKQIFNPQLYRA